ncbi:BrnT family toxin [Sphingomonas naphthae]|uniref:BrnT family toxin n=1 Tax=Sphingomonas naphthae TaxID=1813468 RepID=A0ABY7TPM3_9SPHN|nr:BrnT family toxin [Sphingomonas naphthae]WCT75058.1 BrnT family toxin [Sphingomonas naphthae]
MDIEFDPAKNEANIAKHGLSLADAGLFPISSAVVVADDRREYGEDRQRAFARVDGEGRCLVFTVTATAVRAISYRRAHEKEMSRYGL